MMKSTCFTLEGIPVEFPREPYPSQIEYMRENIRALKSGQNALLESPTGTGKTLCLLCSTLAWQQHIAKSAAAPQSSKALAKIEYGDGPTNSSSSHPSSSTSQKPIQQISQPPLKAQIPTIIYASRTHSQLNQVVEELRKTTYRPKMTVMGSRDQLCVHPKVSKLRGGALNHACNAMGLQHSCSYKNGLDTYNGAAEMGPVDIEVLIREVGKRDRVCPYFYTRELSTTADLILLPYNYLMDASIRKTLQINWINSVVIFDEAHNLERVASDAASFAISTTDIATCIEEVQNCLKILRDKGDCSSSEVDVNRGDSSYNKSGLSTGQSAQVLPTLPGVMRVLRALFEIEKRVDDIPLSKVGYGKTPSCVVEGHWLASMLDAAGLDHAHAYDNIEELKRCSSLLMDQIHGALAGPNGSETPSLSVPEPKISSFANCLFRVFRSNRKQENFAMASDYKVFICEEEIASNTRVGTGGGFSGANGSNSWGGGSGARNNPHTGQRIHVANSLVSTGKKKRIINYWAFSSGIAMDELKKMGVRSFILTSGTLSPMDAFREDMNLPFPIQLENPHVIQNKQLWVGALSMGPSGKPLNSSFSNRSNEYYDELGKSIQNICRAMIGKESNMGRDESEKSLYGGVLVFFPSYSIMDSVIEHWKKTGRFQDLLNFFGGGGVVVEPRGNGKTTATPNSTAWDSRRVSNSGEGSIHPAVTKAHTFSISSSSTSSNSHFSSDYSTEIGGDDEGQMQGVIREFEYKLRAHKRCLLIAVCRGKVSEGIDFKDSNGRIVIITGIPYAPNVDPWVVLKRQYLDDRCKKSSSNVPHSLAVSNVMSTSTLPTHTSSIAIKPSASSALKLDGQAWYNQSASRAVNQAVGRVIRHKNDWGAIFLLDDRFLQDRQISQLSSWLRPRLKKHAGFAAAIEEFRSFYKAALTDKELTPQLDEVKQDKRNVPLKNTLEVDCGYKEVTIDANSLQIEGDGNNFVARELLLTQDALSGNRPPTTKSLSISRKTLSALTTAEANEDNLHTLIDKMKKSSNAAASLPNPPPREDTNLASLYDQNSSKIQASTLSIFSGGGSSNSFSLGAADTRRHNGGIRLNVEGFFQSKAIAPTLNSQLESQQQSVKAFGVPLGSSLGGLKASLIGCAGTSSWNPTRSADATISTHSSSKKVELEQRDTAQMANSSGTDGNTVSIKDDANSKSNDPKASSHSDRLRGGLLSDAIKKVLDKQKFEAFRDEISRMKRSGLDSKSKISVFVDNLLHIFREVHYGDVIFLLGERLKEYLPQEARAMYETVFDKACSAGLKPKPLKRPGTESNPTNQFLNSTSALDPSTTKGSESNTTTKNEIANASMTTVKNEAVAATTTTYKPSERAKKLLLATQQLHVDPNARSNCTNLSKDGNGRDIKSRFSCSICNETPSFPCAGKCGHICCGTCWSKWLKIKLECPICRTSCTKDDIKSIRFR